MSNGMFCSGSLDGSKIWPSVCITVPTVLSAPLIVDFVNDSAPLTNTGMTLIVGVNGVAHDRDRHAGADAVVAGVAHGDAQPPAEFGVVDQRRAPSRS